MMKKVLAVAIASAFAAPAFAATSNVEVGGSVNVSFDYLNADKTPSATQTKDNGNLNVSSNSSNIYFKGSEDLGGGLKAIWQIQTYFSAGGTGNADTGVAGEAVRDGVASGNTYAGLSGGFGTVLLGKHEAPAKLIGRSVDLFGDQIGDNRNLVARSGKGVADLLVALGDTSVNTNGVYSGGFDSRPNNVIAYASPNMSGFSAMVAYVTNVGETGATLDDSIDAWSANIKYDNGPLMLGLGWQKHNLSEADPALRNESVWRLAASYKLGDLRLVGLYQKESNLNNITLVAGNINSVSSADRRTWGLGAAYAMGAITLKGQYYDTNDLASANTGAKMYALGADYAMSKRTKLQFAYATTRNDDKAKYSAFGGGHGDNPGTSNGGNPNGFSVGMRHAF